MKTLLLKIALIGMLVPYCLPAFAQTQPDEAAKATASYKIILVANIDTEKLSLTKQEVQNLFMGGVIQIDLTSVAIAAGDPVRTKFNLSIIGLTESRVQSYWAQMQFTGRKKPPITFAKPEHALAYVARNKNTVTYVSTQTSIPPDLVVVYQ